MFRVNAPNGNTDTDLRRLKFLSISNLIDLIPRLPVMDGSIKCVRCGKPAKPGRKRCVPCTVKAAEWNRLRYHKRRSAGVCPHCGKIRLTSRRECGACRERRFIKKLTPIKMATRPQLSWTISLAKNPGYLYVVVKGRFEPVEFNEMLDDVCGVKENFPQIPVLFSDIEFDVGDMRTSDVASASSHFIRKNPSLAGSKVAIVMKTDADLEVAHQWKGMTEPSSTATLSIFRNERNAMKWLARAT